MPREKTLARPRSTITRPWVKSPATTGAGSPDFATAVVSARTGSLALGLGAFCGRNTGLGTCDCADARLGSQAMPIRRAASADRNARLDVIMVLRKSYSPC